MGREIIKVPKRTVEMEHIGTEGNYNGDDSWMHTDVLDNPPDKPTMSKGLYVDLFKARNVDKSKLVRRPVQVRGKNGKVFTRMQWVDPATGKPPEEHSSKQEEPKKEHKPHTIEEHNPHMSKKEHIDAHVKKMSREDKYAHLAKHEVEWKRNDHPAIDHKNAVEALKRHMYDNPHLAGAEHLPEHSEKTPTGDSKVQNFMDKFKKDPEKLYNIMRELGIADTDPRTVEGRQPKDKGGDGTGAIQHMKNMMALKKHLKDNLHKIDHYLGHSINGVEEKPKKDAPAPSKAQQGGNDIKSILAMMSPKELYSLMREQGIAEVDPRLDPTKAPVSKGGDGTGAIQHMRNMMALKKAIVLNPQILNITPEGIDKPDEKERKESLTGDHLLADKAKDFLSGVSRDTKLKWADSYKEHPVMKSRITSEHEHVDNMHKLSALKKILMNHPDLMTKGSIFEDHRKETLMNLKIKNKDMQKVIRKLLNIPTGDIRQVEKGVEWEFGIGSFARIEENDDGEPVLSVVDTGKDGDEWNEHSINMQNVKEFLESSEDAQPKLVVQEVPLHEKPIEDIYKALNEDYDKHMSPEIGKRLNGEIQHATSKSFFGNSDSLHKFLRGDTKLSLENFQRYLRDSGVFLPDTTRIDVFGDNWNRMALGHMITPTKDKHATEYIPRKYFDSPGFRMFENLRNVVWALNESAKNWTPEERTEARKELLDSVLTLGDVDLKGVSESKVRKNLVGVMHNSLEFVPFDLLSETLKAGNGGIDIHFTNTYTHEASGKEAKMTTSHYNMSSKRIRFQGLYAEALDHSKDLTQVNPNRIFIEGGRKITLPDGSEGVSTSSNLGEVVAHEFAHAVDDFLSGRDGDNMMGGGFWSRFAESKKYGATHYSQSYRDKINSSNPKHKIGARGDSYLFHLDEWLSSYEGRIYNGAYYDNRRKKDYINEKTSTDKKLKEGHQQLSGLEYWSENTVRYANALQEYKQHKQETGENVSIDDWAKRMYEKFTDAGFGDDSNTKTSDGRTLDTYTAQYMSPEGVAYRPSHTMPAEMSGYLYHRMKETHPAIHKIVSSVYGRGDFIGSNEPTLERKYEQGDYTRKSEVSLVIELGGKSI
ncbi:hypothetical protein EalM132_00061 [Exiguobacterium phage vB_EalM-132]|nr:hypothetical protein EalM132_00061 [Exiguobacterium phage vB_EalM-132]